MSEMALTADELIVVGQGRLIADHDHARVHRPRVDAICPGPHLYPGDPA